MINPSLHYAALRSEKESSQWCCSSKRASNSLTEAYMYIPVPFKVFHLHRVLLIIHVHYTCINNKFIAVLL